MDSLHSTMNQHVKGKHLSFEERVIIQTRLKDGCSIRAIARELGCSPSTISYEVRRGTVSLYHGKQKRYKADQGQSVYQINRCHCGRKSAFLKKAGCLTFVPTVVQLPGNSRIIKQSAPEPCTTTLIKD